CMYRSYINVQFVVARGPASARDPHRTSSIRYSPATEELKIIRARVWKHDGGVFDAQELGDRELTDYPSMYYDMRSRQLRYSNLEKRDIVELEYSITPKLRASA